jgi:hypothetical protein
MDPILRAEIEAVVAAADGEESILEKLAYALGLEQYEQPPVFGTRLWEIATGQPARCHICGRSDKWQQEGRVWVCDDHPEYADLPIRAVSHRAVYEVTTFDPAVA